MQASDYPKLPNPTVSRFDDGRGEEKDRNGRETTKSKLEEGKIQAANRMERRGEEEEEKKTRSKRMKRGGVPVTMNGLGVTPTLFVTVWVTSTVLGYRTQPIRTVNLVSVRWSTEDGVWMA